jgi:hypothetical protein
LSGKSPVAGVERASCPFPHTIHVHHGQDAHATKKPTATSALKSRGRRLPESDGIQEENTPPPALERASCPFFHLMHGNDVQHAHAVSMVVYRVETKKHTTVCIYLHAQ